ncbi:MAG: NUDIX hydrolase [Deltaproteobacteria bacterium]
MTLKDRWLSAAQTLWDVMPQSARRRVLFLTNDLFLVGVVGIVSDPEGRVLLLDHRFRTPWRWGLPGGFITRGESLELGLERELREEIGLTGVRVHGRHFDTEVRTERGYVSVALTATLDAAPASIVPRSKTEIVGGGFYAQDEIPDGTYPYHRELLDRWFAAR